MTDSAQLSTRLDAVWPSVMDDYLDLLRIESISSLPEKADEVRRSADKVADLLREAGCPEVQVVAEGGQPAVIGRWPAPQGQPTICLYSHHDVQPTGDLELWTSPPFEPTERDGRLYARGSNDDTAGIAVHLAALRAWEGRPPVGVTVFIEGEEEIGSPSLATIMERHADLLSSDVFVICDATNWQVGQPSVTTTLRGICDCVVEVRTLDHALHSGGFGGVVPDALTTLCRLLATLHDEKGNVAVAGLKTGTAADLDYDEQRLRDDTGLLEGVEWIGDGSAVERIWAKPSISVLAIDSTSVANASNTLAPVARAKVSLRVAPGDNADDALTALVAHLEGHAPWGAQINVSRGETGQPCIVAYEGELAKAVDGAFTEAFGVAPVQVGCGGSIPMIADFQAAFPQAQVVVTAVADPDGRPHGIDESQDLGDLKKAALAEAVLLGRFAR